MNIQWVGVEESKKPRAAIARPAHCWVNYYPEQIARWRNAQHWNNAAGTEGIGVRVLSQCIQYSRRGMFDTSQKARLTFLPTAQYALIRGDTASKSVKTP